MRWLVARRGPRGDVRAWSACGQVGYGMQRSRAGAVVSEWARARIRWPPAGLIPRFQGGTAAVPGSQPPGSYTCTGARHRRGAHVQTDKEEDRQGGMGMLRGFATI